MVHRIDIHRDGRAFWPEYVEHQLLSSHNRRSHPCSVLPLARRVREVALLIVLPSVNVAVIYSLFEG